MVPVMLLSACGAMEKLGSFQLFPETKTVDYKSAGKVPPLDIPPDLIKPTIDERYAIPESEAPTSATFLATKVSEEILRKPMARRHFRLLR